MMSGLRGMGFLIYREARGICPDYDKGGSALGNVGWIGVSKRCPTLHQSRVHLTISRGHYPVVPASFKEFSHTISKIDMPNFIMYWGVHFIKMKLLN